jgi:hypothetical protein
VKHGGADTEDNLALCCAVCNRRKGADLASLDPVTGTLERLFHPRRDRWPDHFRIGDGEIAGISPVGRTTVRLLQLNRPARVRERQLLARLSKIVPDERRRE